MLRTLLHFFLLGGMLFGAKAAFQAEDASGPHLTVQVPRSAPPAAAEKAIDEAILLNEARRYGWDRTDPIVFTHLVRNMRFIEPDSNADDRELFARALRMKMHQHDPIVRARLLYRARKALESVPEDRIPTRDELQAHLQTHPERFERAGRVRLQHVFLSRSKRGEALPADARKMRGRLDALGDARPTGLGDPLPGLRQEQLTTAGEIQDEYGAQLGQVVEEAVVGPWRGPVPSVYGLHFLRIVAKEPPYVPPLAVIGAEVRGDLLLEIRKQLRQERMAALRDAYIIDLQRVP
jgi:hypothetical protein